MIHEALTCAAVVVGIDVARAYCGLAATVPVDIALGGGGMWLGSLGREMLA